MGTGGVDSQGGRVREGRVNAIRILATAAVWGSIVVTIVLLLFLPYGRKGVK